jgi:V/A-type H+-transporting ATPase subunit D
MRRLQASLRLARRGHDLLEQKRRILMAELMSRLKDAAEIQASVLSMFGDAYFSLQMANIAMGINRVEKIANLVPEEEHFTIRLRSIMGIDIPDVDKIEPDVTPVYSFGGTSEGSSSVFDTAYVNARKLVSLIARLAETETSVVQLAMQIRKTLRRVNALEKVFIPRGERQIKYIADVLDENEREDMTRVKLSSRRA